MTTKDPDHRWNLHVALFLAAFTRILLPSFTCLRSALHIHAVGGCETQASREECNDGRRFLPGRQTR